MNHENLLLFWKLVPIELWNSFYMVIVSGFFAVSLGLPLGIILTLTSAGHLKANKAVYTLLGILVNTGRSFPFAILMVALIPFTRLIVGTSLGTTAAIVPLSLAAIPFFARLAENAFHEIDHPLIEATQLMGATTCQIILKVLIPEALPSLIAGATTTLISLIGYSAMAGTMGGGGLGKIAIQYGYQRFNPFLMTVTVILLILFVQGVQVIGNRLVYLINQKRGRTWSR